jgi:hypothetical protein
MTVRAFAALALVAAAALPARAQPGVTPAPGAAGPTKQVTEIDEPLKRRSPQWIAFELKLTPYVPDIDQSSGLGPGREPFRELFQPQGQTGQPPPRLLTQLELDVEFFHRFGTLAVGATAGFYRRTSHSFQFQPDGSPCIVGSCVRSGDETALNIIPLSLLFIYRFDVLAERYHVPFVPYVKLGLAYYIWVIQGGGGGVATFTDADGNVSEGYGGTFGWVIHPGVSLLLDYLDPAVSRTLDGDLGINHTYLFVELHHADIRGFGQPGRMNLSDTTVNAGLGFEF